MTAEPVSGPAGWIEEMRAFPWLDGVILFLGGVAVFQPIALTWSDNPNYSFGWLIPFVSLLLFVERWPSRPPRTGRTGKLVLAPWIILAGVIFLAFRLAAEADPGWRPGLWILVGLYVGSLLAWLYIHGGRAWVRHFAFPVCFLLLSLPWFFEIEYPLTQGLMRWNALIVAAALKAFGVSASATGNIIQLKYSQLGVEEACSGILSLQASLMMGFLLGEVYRLSIPRRLAVVAIGIALALAGNFLRTFFLGMVAFYGGTVAHWHDIAGYFILVFVGIGTWLATLVFSSRSSRPHVAASSPHLLPQEYGNNRNSLRIALEICLVSLFAQLVTQMWFGWRETSLTRKPEWSIALPAVPGLQEMPVTELQRQTLQCDEARTGQWLDERNWQWTVFWFKYRPKPSNRVVLDMHNPDICLPAVGMVKDRDYLDFSLRVKGIDLLVQPKRFLVGQSALYLFWIVYANRGNLPPQMNDTVNADYASKFQAHLWDVWTGNRGIGVETLEVGLMGSPDYETARAAYIDELNHLVLP